MRKKLLSLVDDAAPRVFRESAQQYTQYAQRKKKKEREKRAAADKVPGGLADHKPDSRYPEDQLRKGQKVELEHTDTPALAREIAKDHLEEDRRYYDKLERVEKTAFWRGFDHEMAQRPAGRDLERLLPQRS